ncbi:MAG: DUF3461 family protein [Granulosicoccaceae bacterium]
MSEYKTLDEMGIKNPDQIVRYNAYNHNNIDFLRITYKRQAGSILPKSRRYQFGRASKMVVTDGGTNQRETVFEVSPVFQRALSELDQLLDKAKKTDVTKEHLIEELDRLERDFHASQAALRAMIKQL